MNKVQVADVHGPGEDPVAVLGTGIMGSAMARNLAGAGLRTTIRDRSPSAPAPLPDAGALVAASPAEAIRDARLVITMLPTRRGGGVGDLRQRMAEAFRQGAVWAQMGTISVAATTGIAGRLGQLRPARPAPAGSASSGRT